MLICNTLQYVHQKFVARVVTDYLKGITNEKGISAAAIVISLIFVGFQIQDGNRETRSATQQAVTDQTVMFIMNIATDEHLPRVLGEVITNQARFGDFTLEEITRINSVSIAALRRFENIYLQVEAGNLDEQSLRSSSSVLYRSQYIKDFWPGIKDEFDPNFASYFEAYIAE
jgi:hypothetical protein